MNSLRDAMLIIGTVACLWGSVHYLLAAKALNGDLAKRQARPVGASWYECDRGCEMTTLNGKVALVTGGSRGIGRAIATRFLEAGCTVHVAARDGAMLQAFAGSLHVGGDRIVTHVADLSTPAGVADLAARCGDSDILINNAGQYLPGPSRASTTRPGSRPGTSRYSATRG